MVSGERDMISNTLLHSGGLSQLAERQMRTWALQLQAQQRLEEERAAKAMEQRIRPYLALSRETGVHAHELAQAVAEKCGWKLFDRELLDYMAEHDHISRFALDFVDETVVSWFRETFGKWLDEQLVSQAEYVSRLGKIVLLAAQHESTVFVGRGVQFILPRENGVAVRIIAPRKVRIAQIRKQRQCSLHDAEKFVDHTDHERAEFVRRYFLHDVADPHLYDLVINLQHVPRAAAVEMIVRECQRRQQVAAGPAR
jgi:cytidylate kinase